MASVHGTITAYQRHLKRRDDPCRECRDAWAAYQADYKAKHPPSAEAKERQRQRALAKGRALWRLRLEYATRYLELYAQELNGGDPDD